MTVCLSGAAIENMKNNLTFGNTIMPEGAANRKASYLFITLLAACVVPGAPIHAQLVESSSKINVTTKVSPPKVAPGASFQVTIDMTVAEGWHINSHTPSVEGMIATGLELEKKEGLELASVSYPEGKSITIAISDEPLNVFEGTVRIVAAMKTKGSLKGRTAKVPLKLSVQACNDRVCLAPSTLALPVSIQLSPARKKSP